MRSFLGGFSLLLLAMACERAPTPPAPNLHPAQANQPASSPIQFVALPGWQRVAPGSSFTLMQWTLPGSGLATLSSVGGGVEANFTRWEEQFEVTDGGKQMENLEGGAYGTAMLILRGKLMATRSLGGGEPMENWMLIGACLQGTPLGDLYLKVLGPETALQDQLEALRQAILKISISA